MSFGMGFYTGLRALRASQLAIQTVGQNISNVNTAGYSRQQVLLSATQPISLQRGFQVGTGVQVDTIRRLTDESLLARINTQTGLFGRAAVQHNRLKEVEGIFAEPGEAGLGTLLSGFFSGISSLTPDPSDRALRGGAIQAGQTLAEGLNLLSGRMGEIQDATLRDVRMRLEEVNRLAAAIADLNVKIGETEVRGVQANDLRDQRDQHLQSISRLIDATGFDRAGGQMDVMAGGYLLVSGTRASMLEAGRGSDGSTKVLIAGSDNTLSLRSGEIQGLLGVEQEQIPGLVSVADTLARNLILEVNRLHSTGVPGSGPFTRLRAESAIVDGDGDGEYTDELLGSAGLPFEIGAGAVHVSVTELATGLVTRTRIDIEPGTMSVGDLVQRLGEVPNLSASVDPSGRLLITAAQGHGFDFSSRLDPSPDKAGALGVPVSVSGSYTGSANRQLRFSALADGQIGVTEGLKVEVRDQQGALVATLDVGRGYSPGDALEVADGILVEFGPGSISASGGGSFVLDALADPDSSDLLVAFGLNSFFTGTGAADMSVSSALLENPGLLCAGLSSAPGDGANLERLLALRDRPLDALQAATLEDYYTDSLGALGFEVSRLASLSASESDLLSFLEDRRQETSGVSLDEEMLELVRFQHSFQAASRFINTISDLTQTLIQLGS